MINKIKQSALDMLEAYEARQLYRQSQSNSFRGSQEINRQSHTLPTDNELDRKMLQHIDLVLGEELGSYYINHMPPNHGYLITEDRRHHVIRSVDDLRQYVFRENLCLDGN